MNSPTSNDLNRALEHQVEHLDTAPLTLGDVQARAKRIQRRRRIAACVAAAAAVAIIAPIGLMLGNNQPDSRGPIKQPSGSPSQTVPTTRNSVTYEIDVTPPAEGTTGGEPGVPYWSNGQLLAPTGEAVPIADPVRNAIQEANGQWAGVVQDDQANYTWTSYDTSGAVLDTSPALSDNVAVTPDGASYAYLAQNDAGSAQAAWQLVLGGPDARSWDLGRRPPSAPGAGPIGILSDGTVVYEFEAGKPMLALADGTTQALPGRYLSTRSASSATGLIAAQTSYNDDGTSCWAVVDATGDTKAESCDYQLSTFSADGAEIIGYDSQTDGLGPRSVSILDTATLEPLATFTMPTDGHISSQLAWAGDSVVAKVWQEGSWYVELLGRDGPLQLRSVSFPGDGIDAPPFHVAAGPLDVVG